MEHQWNETDRGKPVPVPLCPPQIPHGLTRDRNRASVVGGRRLTAWTMARPTAILRLCTTINGLSKMLGQTSSVRPHTPQEGKYFISIYVCQQLVFDVRSKNVLISVP
jgi:hypothetical protein